MNSKEFFAMRDTVKAAYVDCKLMDLYKDETISFEDLQKLVYKDCEL